MSRPVTDRAKRYRANREGVRPPDPRVCGFCGSDANVEVDHIDGDESHGEPDNLMWLCRSCNTRKGRVLQSAGLGVLTAQYNPASGASGIDQWTVAADVLRGLRAGSVQRAVRTVRSTPVQRRRQFAARLQHNPGAETLEEFAAAVGALEAGCPDLEMVVLEGTPRGRWDHFAAEIERANPGRHVPTYAQYAMGASMHQRGRYLGGGRWAPGAHDEGGAIIHATPRALRREYAERIAEKRRSAAAEVPF